MYQLFQDSMAICQFCQKPDIFLTMTANSKWPEITEALLKFNADVTDNVQHNDANRRQGHPQQGSDQLDIIA